MTDEPLIISSIRRDLAITPDGRGGELRFTPATERRGGCGCPGDNLVAWADEIEARIAQAWSEGHAAGRDYQGDGWNSDAHDPEEDNPYRTKGQA